MTVIFDAGDIDHLVRRFNLAELRHEAHQANIQAAVCRTFGEDDWEDFYRDYQASCELAIDVTLSCQPKPKHSAGRVDIRQVKGALDIVAIASHYTTLRNSGNRFIARCPFHEDKHPSFTVYPENQSWFCFSCNRGGDAIDLVMLADHLDFKAAVGVLSGT